jgi:hypothetical protein
MNLSTITPMADGTIRYGLPPVDVQTSGPFLFTTTGHKVAPQGTRAARIRKALDTPVKANYNDVPLGTALAAFEKTSGLIFIVRWPGEHPTLSLRLDDQPLGVVLEAISDQTGATFFVRDYGILITPERANPPNAVRLIDFWKAARSSGQQPAPKPEEPEK